MLYGYIWYNIYVYIYIYSVYRLLCLVDHSVTNSRWSSAPCGPGPARWFLSPKLSYRTCLSVSHIFPLLLVPSLISMHHPFPVFLQGASEVCRAFVTSGRGLYCLGHGGGLATGINSYTGTLGERQLQRKGRWESTKRDLVLSTFLQLR